MYNLQRSDIMRVFVNLKQIGKKRNSVEKREYEIKDDISSIKDLIIQFVTVEVEKFNQRADDISLIDFLTKEEIQDKTYIGKIDFNADYNKKKQDLQSAIDNALQSYTDGIYCIFIGEERLEDDIAMPVSIKADDNLTFVRLTMLSGRMW